MNISKSSAGALSAREVTNVYLNNSPVFVRYQKSFDSRMVQRNTIASVFLILILIQLIIHTSSKEYEFKQYKFRKKRDDKHYRHAKSQCETSAHCQKLLTRPLDHTRCVRLCISEKCYSELYGHDELEEGEIDVRLNSFKGCYFLDLRSRDI